MLPRIDDSTYSLRKSFSSMCVKLVCMLFALWLPAPRLSLPGASLDGQMARTWPGYRDAQRNGWMKFLSASYPPGSKRLSLDLSEVQTKMVVEDDAVLSTNRASTQQHFWWPMKFALE